MSEVVEVPVYLRSKSGEVVSQRFLDWVRDTQKKLRKAFPPGERAFCRILDKSRSRLPARWRSRLCYNRQKYFVVAQSVVFFGDFYFSNMRLLVEVDGTSHAGEAAREKDEWRERLISAWKVKTVRIKNEVVLDSDFRDVEQWFYAHAAAACPHRTGTKLLNDYNKMKRKHPHIYEAVGMIPTYRHPH